MKYLIVLLLSMGSLPLLCIAQQKSPDKLDQFLAIAEDLFRKAQLPGAGLSIVHQGEIIYTGGFGYANLDRQQPVSDTSLFVLASTTKAFTGLIAAKLVDQGLLDWKTPIIHYLPDFTLSEPYIAEHINLEDLFTHMSGLAQDDQLWLGQPISREAVFQQTATLPFTHSFRSTWAYNNHAYVIIGKVLETVSGQSWETLLQELIFDPLGMNQSCAQHDHFLQNPNHVTGYFGDGKTIRPHNNSDNIAPAGGISSTPKDMAKWLQFIAQKGNLNGTQQVSKEVFEYLTQPKGMSFTDTCSVQYYSIGWGGLRTAGRRTLRHGGAIAGNSARVSVMPDDGFGIFVGTNQRSDFKDILTDYAEQLFVHENFQRDTIRENVLINLNRFIQFQNTLLAEGIPAAKAYHERLLYTDFEADLIALGNAFLEAGYLEPAVFVFELNCQERPTSIQALSQYAKVLIQQGDLDKAKEQFEKILEYSPNHPAAKEALKDLENR
ncbi:MAG: serine hydrolase [Bacteroidota bacterium]